MTPANKDHVHRASRDLAQSGMRIREVVPLQAGTSLFRFVDSATAAFAQDRLMRNWWWFRREARENFRESSRTGRSLAEIVRSNGAIIDDFRNRCGAMIVATVRCELAAYCGPGLAVDRDGPLNGRELDQPAGRGIGVPAPGHDQLFIPGLEVPGNAVRWIEFERAVGTAYASTLLQQGASPSGLVQAYSFSRKEQ